MINQQFFSVDFFTIFVFVLLFALNLAEIRINRWLFGVKLMATYRAYN